MLNTPAKMMPVQRMEFTDYTHARHGDNTVFPLIIAADDVQWLAIGPFAREELADDVLDGDFLDVDIADGQQIEQALQTGITRSRLTLSLIWRPFARQLRRTLRGSRDQSPRPVRIGW